MSINCMEVTAHYPNSVPLIGKRSEWFVVCVRWQWWLACRYTYVWPVCASQGINRDGCQVVAMGPAGEGTGKTFKLFTSWNVLMNLIVFRHPDRTDCSKTMTNLYCMANTIVVDILATQEVRALDCYVTDLVNPEYSVFSVHQKV